VTLRQASRAARASRTLLASTAIGQGSSAGIVDLDAADIFSDVAAGVQTLLSPDGRLNMDKKAALLQVTDFPDRLDQVQLYLDAVQNRATRQVQIRATVIEIELNDEFATGIDWSQVCGAAESAPASGQGHRGGESDGERAE
jgi:type II secretory pathway component GspD/PulD (secretin)